MPLPIPGRASLAGFRQMHAGAGEEAFNRLPSAPAAPPELVERGERLELNGSSHAFPLCYGIREYEYKATGPPERSAERGPVIEDYGGFRCGARPPWGNLRRP